MSELLPSTPGAAWFDGCQSILSRKYIVKIGYNGLLAVKSNCVGKTLLDLVVSDRSDRFATNYIN